jgi:hypothetical protein
MTSPVDVRIGWGADIRGELLPILISSSRHLVERYPRLSQIGGVEPLGEPTVDRGKRVAGFGAATRSWRSRDKARGGAGDVIPDGRGTSPGMRIYSATSRSWQK